MEKMRYYNTAKFFIFSKRVGMNGFVPFYQFEEFSDIYMTKCIWNCFGRGAFSKYSDMFEINKYFWKMSFNCNGTIPKKFVGEKVLHFELSLIFLIKSSLKWKFVRKFLMSKQLSLSLENTLWWCYNSQKN